MSSSNPRWSLTPSAIFRYGVAVLSVTAALIIAWWMEFAWQSAAHVSLFLCAVMFSAWFGGIRPGLLAIALSVLAFDYYFMPPIYSRALKPQELPRLLFFALSAQDVAGMPVVETYLPEERTMYWERLKKLNAGARLRFERIFVRKDAIQLPVEVSSPSMRHGYSQVVVRDISERKRAETKLRRSEAYLAEAQKLSRTGSWAGTADLLESTYWSAEMFRLMGLPKRDNPPTTEEMSKYFAPEAWAGILELFETARRKKTTWGILCTRMMAQAQHFNSRCRLVLRENRLLNTLSCRPNQSAKTWWNVISRYTL
jgi:hypothetical protein